MAEVTLDMLIAELKEMIPTLQHHGGYFPHDEYPDKGRYERWLAATKRFLSINFPHDKYVIEFEETSKLILRLGQQQRLLAILEAFADQPTIIPQENNEKKEKGINIAINQSQTQEQSCAINMFLEAIKDDLTGKQIKELKKVVDESGDDKEKAKNGIISKLKSFGSDVASNIVANIITNPMIWSSL